MEKQLKQIAILIEKASQEHDAVYAMQYAQAAWNVANALACLRDAGVLEV